MTPETKRNGAVFLLSAAAGFLVSKIFDPDPHCPICPVCGVPTPQPGGGGAPAPSGGGGGGGLASPPSDAGSFFPSFPVGPAGQAVIDSQGNPLSVGPQAVGPQAVGPQAFAGPVTGPVTSAGPSAPLTASMYGASGGTSNPNDLANNGQVFGGTQSIPGGVVPMQAPRAAANPTQVPQESQGYVPSPPRTIQQGGLPTGGRVIAMRRPR